MYPTKNTLRFVSNSLRSYVVIAVMYECLIRKRETTFFHVENTLKKFDTLFPLSKHKTYKNFTKNIISALSNLKKHRFVKMYQKGKPSLYGIPEFLDKNISINPDINPKKFIEKLKTALYTCRQAYTVQTFIKYIINDLKKEKFIIDTNI